MRDTSSAAARAQRLAAWSLATVLLALACTREDRAPTPPAESAAAVSATAASKGDDRLKPDKGDKGDKHDDKGDKGDKHDDKSPNQTLVLTVAPAGAVAGRPFATQPVVEIRKKGGDLLRSDRWVAAALVGTKVHLGGATLIHANDGVATFTDLAVPVAGTFTLAFSAPDVETIRVPLTVESAQPPAPVTLTVTRDGAGTGRVASDVAGIDCGIACAADFAVGTALTLTATPSAGSTFTGWSGACTGTGTCAVTMDAAKTVTATFGVAQYALTVTSAGTGTGVVSSSPAGIDCGASCTASFPSGQAVVLTVSNADDVVFAGWSGACTGTGPCTLTMDAAKSVTATFDLRQQTTLMVLYGGNGSGTVESSPAGIFCDGGPFPCGGQFYQGTVVTLTATPDAASLFTGWSGACTSTTATTCTVTMGTTQLKVTPTFTLKPGAAIAAGPSVRARGGP